MFSFSAILLTYFRLCAQKVQPQGAAGSYLVRPFAQSTAGKKARIPENLSHKLAGGKQMRTIVRIIHCPGAPG
jgi:hypothetical protein